jgi:hypothetical protein
VSRIPDIYVTLALMAVTFAGFAIAWTVAT